MLITDPIADMIIRIKNAVLASQESVTIPYSKMKEAIANVLRENNYIDSFEVIEKKVQGDIKINLLYRGKLSVINGVKRLSTPGRRLYTKSNNIPKALSGYGITIVSTSKGLMTDKDAKKSNLGGELICQIW